MAKILGLKKSTALYYLYYALYKGLITNDLFTRVARDLPTYLVLRRDIEEFMNYYLIILLATFKKYVTLPKMLKIMGIDFKTIIDMLTSIRIEDTKLRMALRYYALVESLCVRGYITAKELRTLFPWSVERQEAISSIPDIKVIKSSKLGKIRKIYYIDPCRTAIYLSKILPKPRNKFEQWALIRILHESGATEDLINYLKDAWRGRKVICPSITNEICSVLE